MAVLTETKSDSTTKVTLKKSNLKASNSRAGNDDAKETSFKLHDGPENKSGTGVSYESKAKTDTVDPKPKRKKAKAKANKAPQAEPKGLAKLHRLLSAADYLAKTTHFTVEEVSYWPCILNICQCKVLLYLHNKLEYNGPLDKMKMREVLHVVFEITDGVMLDLAYKAFDRDSDNWVNELEWVQGLSIMLRGSTDELSDWCYFIYDMNGDGGLAREELAHCLKGCIIPGYGGVEFEEAEECERDIVELAMRKLDIDKDGQITREDFVIATKQDPLLLVSVGPCLPPVKCCAAFMALITERFRSFTGPLGTKEVEKKVKMPHAGMAHSGRKLSVIGSRIQTAKSHQSVRIVPSVSHVKKLTENNEIRFKLLSDANSKTVRSSKE
ncbi:EF-hand calcium-binding domain-containing protein 1 [Orchesella cincta]|uniref:EF-hand calcium-binding domain-containing protein 1 n=1 Tax=Orchesella cincta TaxID=48709 RepID=A0A1D2NEL8_ORCCI|nr:EF-hand calcium-binding domain-containing protein 1 [Orchesella cincta]